LAGASYHRIFRRRLLPKGESLALHWSPHCRPIDRPFNHWPYHL
jgi:hypothetical protein